MTRPSAGPEPVALPGGGLGRVVRLRLDLAYDGSGFAGWARQPGQRTVQGVVEEALRQVLHLTDAPGLVVAGRTDAGVHARGQVAHVDLPGSLADVRGAPLQSLVRRLGGVLPADVRLTAVSVAPDGFDARFSPLWRRYAYRVGDTDWGVDPLHRGHVLWYPRRLDVDAMNDAAAPLVGERDFAAFCRRRPGATTIRRLLELSWARRDGLVVARVVADAFCHSMVRSLVGAFLAVGEGRRPVEWPAEVLARGLRDSAVHVVRPHGLTLEEVAYPPDGDLATRATETRRRRTLPV